MAGNCIVDDAACCEASRKEIVRRYYKCLCDLKIPRTAKESERYKLELLMNQAGLTQGARPSGAGRPQRNDRRCPCCRH